MGKKGPLLPMGLSGLGFLDPRSPAGGEKNRYLPGKQYRILRKGKAVRR